MKTMRITKRIQDLVDGHVDVRYVDCPGCPACDEIVKLRKGLEQGYKNVNIGKVEKKMQAVKVKKEDYLALDSKLTDRQKAEKLGIGLSTLYNKKTEWGLIKARETAKKETKSNKTKEANEKLKEIVKAEENTVANVPKVEALKNGYVRNIIKGLAESDQEQRVDELNARIQDLLEKNKNLAAAFDDIENELAEVKEKLHAEKKKIESLMVEVAEEREKTQFYEYECKKLSEALRETNENLLNANKDTKVYMTALVTALMKQIS